MSLIKLFSDELSVLNNRESLYKIHLQRTQPQSIFETPPHNIGTDNLLVFVDGKLQIKNLDFIDFSSNSIQFTSVVQPNSIVSILLIRTGADYTYGNTAISQFHHSLADPIPDSGKNDDYHLNITSGDLFSKTNGTWVKIYSIGSGEGGTGGTTGGTGVIPFCKLIYQSLSSERTQNSSVFEIPLVNIALEMPLVYINGFMVAYGRDYIINEGKYLVFNSEISLDKDIIVYKVARKNAGGSFELLFSLLKEERTMDLTSIIINGDLNQAYEKEMVYLNGFLLINGRDYTIINKTIIFNFTVKKEWDIYVYKIGEGEIFGFAETVLVSPKDSRNSIVRNLNLNYNLSLEKDSLFCFLNGFLLVKDRDYVMTNNRTIQFSFDIKKEDDVVIYRWTNRIKPTAIEWNYFNV